MKLADWLKEREMSQAAFARKAGVSQGAIARFVLGMRTPNKAMMRKILDATEGRVTPNDFHDMDRPQDAA